MGDPAYTTDRLIRVMQAHFDVNQDTLEDAMTEVIAGILFMARKRGYATTGIAERAVLMAANMEHD